MAQIQVREELSATQHRRESVGRREMDGSMLRYSIGSKLGSVIELHKSDTLQNNTDFHSIGKMFCASTTPVPSPSLLELLSFSFIF